MFRNRGMHHWLRGDGRPWRESNVVSCCAFASVGPSIKYITLFLANFDPPSPCHTLSHIPRPPKVRHTSRTTPPPNFSRISTKTLTKAPCTNSLSIVRGGFCPEFLSFVWKVLSVPLLSECMSFNRKLNIT